MINMPFSASIRLPEPEATWINDFGARLIDDGIYWRGFVSSKAGYISGTNVNAPLLPTST